MKIILLGMPGAGKGTQAELIKVNDHSSIMLADVTDLDKLKEFMSVPEMLEWDKQNNCVDHVYSMERIN